VQRRSNWRSGRARQRTFHVRPVLSIVQLQPHFFSTPWPVHAARGPISLRTPCSPKSNVSTRNLIPSCSLIQMPQQPLRRPRCSRIGGSAEDRCDAAKRSGPLTMAELRIGGGVTVRQSGECSYTYISTATRATLDPVNARPYAISCFVAIRKVKALTAFKTRMQGPRVEPPLPFSHTPIVPSHKLRNESASV
jgi:hypothetical protein